MVKESVAGALLQRGLGIAAEDRERRQLPRGDFVWASTGPRHRCRGSQPARCLPEGDGGASTGPRHRCRGSTLPRVGSPGERVRFNGASASLPRIDTIGAVVSTLAQMLQRGLGIAAEDRVGPAGVTACVSVLQRGLGIAAEDRCRQRWLPHARDQASTGPRHRCRGSARRSRPGRPRARGFNGASASLPRIGPNGVLGYIISTMLQRGLGIAAEDRASSMTMKPNWL